MDVVIFVGVLALIFAILDSKKFFNKGLQISFFIIFIFLAFRYQYGNDYRMYQGFFKNVSHYSVSFNDLGKKFEEHFEIGWQYLNKIFSFIGLDFTWLIIAISLFNVIVVYKFIKAFVPREYYWLAVFIYVFNYDYMLIHLSAIRQLLSILIMLISLKYLLNNKVLKFIIAIGIASLFHTSSLVLLLLIPIKYFARPINKHTATIVTIAYFTLFFVSYLIVDFINVITKVYLDRYDVYQSEGEGEINTGLGFLVTFIYLIYVLYGLSKTQDKKEQFILWTSLFSVFLSVLSIQIMMLYRVNMYFLPFIVVSFPIIASVVKDYFFKRAFILLILMMTLYNFFGFFQSEIYGEYYINYKTIFDK